MELLPEDPLAVGVYTVVSRLGAGGQAIVYLGGAPDGGLVAIKVLHSHLSLEERARNRFLREAEAAEGVAPFCIARVLDSGLLGHRPYIVSEYIDGPSLQDAILASGPWEGVALERLAVTTATALAAIHRAGVVHRDFKPANVLLGPDGPVVIDFGIAHASHVGTTETSQVVGSPAYMAPELISGPSTGPASDLFSWAATIVYAATGRRAFTSDSVPGVMHQILHDEPDLGSLTGRLRRLVSECLAKDPAERPSADQLHARLLEHLLPTSTDSPPSASIRSQPQAPEPLTPTPSAAAAQINTGLPEHGRSGRLLPGRWRHPRSPLIVGAAAAALMVVLAGVFAPEAFDSGASHTSTHLTAELPADGAAPRSPAPSASADQHSPGQAPQPGQASRPGQADDPGHPSAHGSQPIPHSSPSTRKPDHPKVAPPRRTSPAAAPRQLGMVSIVQLGQYCYAHNYGSTTGTGCQRLNGTVVRVSYSTVCRWLYPAYPNAVATASSYMDVCMSS